MLRKALAGSILASLAVAALASAPARAATREEAVKELQQLSAQVMEQFRQKNYEEAAKLCARMMELAPRMAEPHYNLACARARQGKTDEAFAALAKSIELGYGDPDHMKADEDLESLRSDKRFEEMLKKAGENRATGGAAYEPGAEMEGIKTVERSPANGLRYRIRMSPAATAEKPNRLIVWLHPSGGSANSVVEPLAPVFVKMGFAVMVTTQKQWMGWTGPEMTTLLNVSLPDANTIPGLDAKRPLLMGFSAGGQAALSVWPENASKFGGMILDAAYPVQLGSGGPGGMSPLPIPKDPGIKDCPFFVLVGELDGGSQVWKKAEPDWRKAEIPLVIRYVPGKGHAWLFGKEELEALTRWLGEVAEGKRPADAPGAPPQAPEKK
jgi:predicted esterase